MRLKDFVVLIIRLLLGFIFFSSGMSKLAQGNFGQLIGPTQLIGMLEEYDLVGFGYLIAITQVIAGILILSQRFSLVGLIILIPMNISILSFTLSQGWQGTPFINAFFLILNLLALFYEFHTWKFLFMKKTSGVEPSRATLLFPKQLIPAVLLLLSLWAMGISDGGGIGLHVVASLIVILVTMNLFQVHEYLLAEKLVLLSFCLTSLTVVHLRYINEFFSGALLIVAGFVMLGFLFLIVSVVLRLRQQRISAAL